MYVHTHTKWINFLGHLYEFRKRGVAHQRKVVFENKLVQIILRILLSHLSMAASIWGQKC